ncbi:MAG: hypothetical protein NTNFB02_27880 [Nitrospira sp.]
MLEGSSSDISVFSDEEVQFLTPRIAKALSTATAGEAVAFVVRSPRRHSGRFENALAETTAGSLYAYDLSLYVTLSQFHYAPGQTQPKPDGTPRLRLLDTSGLSDRSLQFTPSAAQRPESVHRQTGETSPGRTVAIDYQLLQRASPSEAVGEQFPSPAKHVIAPTHGALPESGRAETPSQTAETLAQREAEIHTLKDLVIKKDLELETLRKELQSIKKQLEEQTARPDGRKGKPKPPSNLQHTAP